VVAKKAVATAEATLKVAVAVAAEAILEVVVAVVEEPTAAINKKSYPKLLESMKPE
jgi:hypothetical protein